MTNVLITGADGFIGKALCKQLVENGFSIVKAVRSARSADSAVNTIKTVVCEIDAATNWQEALQGVDVVIHLAARVHVTTENDANSLAEFRKVNLEGTHYLAKQAATAGVRRFIFISSIKVNGENTLPGQAFTAEDNPAPLDAYGISKREAEDALRGVALETGMQFVIIRPPIVYGPGVRANFQTLMCCLHRRIPLPLGAITNRRSILALDNLVDLILTCVGHPAAANQTFLAKDEADISTTELSQRLATALHKKAILLSVPVPLIKLVALLFGKTDTAQKLCGSLQVDMRKTFETLGWTPPISTDEALLKTAQHYAETLK